MTGMPRRSLGQVPKMMIEQEQELSLRAPIAFFFAASLSAVMAPLLLRIEPYPGASVVFAIFCIVVVSLGLMGLQRRRSDRSQERVVRAAFRSGGDQDQICALEALSFSEGDEASDEIGVVAGGQAARGGGNIDGGV